MKAFPALAAALLLAGCASSGGPQPTNASTPERTFERVRDAILAGDLDTAFEGYSDRKKRMEGGLEGFRKKYEASKDEWVTLFTGSRVTFVAIDKEQATVVVLWGNGERYPPVSFVLDKGAWKIDQ